MASKSGSGRGKGPHKWSRYARPDEVRGEDGAPREGSSRSGKGSSTAKGASRSSTSSTSGSRGGSTSGSRSGSKSGAKSGSKSGSTSGSKPAKKDRTGTWVGIGIATVIIVPIAIGVAANAGDDDDYDFGELDTTLLTEEVIGNALDEAAQVELGRTAALDRADDPSADPSTDPSAGASEGGSADAEAGAGTESAEPRVQAVEFRIDQYYLNVAFYDPNTRETRTFEQAEYNIDEGDYTVEVEEQAFDNYRPRPFYLDELDPAVVVEVTEEAIAAAEDPYSFTTYADVSESGELLIRVQVSSSGDDDVEVVTDAEGDPVG